MAKTVYKFIKIAGFLSFLPFVLLTGPLGGFFLGDFLEKRFFPTLPWSIIFSVIGILVSIRETIRIIRLVIKLEKES